MELNEDLKTVKDVIQAVLKSKKMIRMYPSNNPIYVKTLEDCYTRFAEFFGYRDELVFKIRQNEIIWEGEQVYASAEKDDNLALFFFKDGLREITFKKGFAQNEMEEFLKIISTDFEREVLDDDIITLLWEKDFQNIQYVADDAILSEEDNYETDAVEHVREVSNESDSVLKAYQDAFTEADVVREVTIVPLSDKELQHLMQELEKESSDKTGKLINILFELIYFSETREDLEDLAGYFMNAVEYSMRQGDIQMVQSVLVRIQELVHNKNINQEMVTIFKKVIVYAGSEPIVRLIGETLDSGQDLDDKVIEDLVRHLDKNAIIPFMNILGELKNIHGRKVVIDALICLGPRDIMTLSKGLNDSRWYVVRNIIYILRKIADKRAVEYLLKTVRHADIRVKKEVIRALGELGGTGVFLTLKECLDDSDVQVRSAALRSLGTIGSEAAKRAVIDKIREKSFKDRNLDEKKEYFEVLSKWKDSEVFTFLSDMLRKKSFFFGSSKTDEKRACAAYALGLLGNKDAAQLLRKFKGDGSKLVREFCFTAIKRLDHDR